ncbi:adenylate cyclase [Enhydrobacter aerosaccus]|uniref:Adenylate cyclase n=1 Tax=Enhydrobacter aerosaccus TaxID=225324 RepID=A0A1T4SVC0_9HYPH|nr:adenylate/guanylate cyclase domain-containing protein [Enhydrobacter aerosaccus]SKA31858.1 adenylate cyclase [Enhydrobacter aerosaccus]
MRCPNCDTANASNARFCIECGVALWRTCPSCSANNLPTAHYCGQCGIALDASPPPPRAIGPKEAALRQTTVLFADVSGSTELIASLDPEEAAKRLAPAIEAMQAAVRQYEGAVVRVQGDGVMALFGAPRPQEDHAVRACYAAFALQSMVKALAAEPFQVRVGIHSGEVLARTVATDFSTEFDATGITVHIASRLESLAPPGGIVVSLATMKSARQYISIEPMGKQAIRGLANPLEVFLLTGLRKGRAASRFAVEARRSTFVGRERELELLQRGLDRAIEGEGCAIGIVGEAGIGKSRLCFEFTERCRAMGVRILEGRAVAHSRATPFEPMIDLAKAFFEISAEDDPARARQKIAATLQGLGPELVVELPLLLDFLGLSEGAATEKPDPAARRDRLNGLLRQLARLASRDAPAVILFEDLHFMDSGSESLIEVLAETLTGTRLLLLVNFRPGYSASWMRGDHYDQISLAPLRHAAAGALAEDMLGGDESVEPLLSLVADRARGNPFFIEELVRKFEESGHLVGGPGHYRLVRIPDIRIIPDNVQAIVSARVDDRPELERTLLQTAAVIGREFVAAVLARVTHIQDALVNGALRRLSSAGLIYESGGAVAGGFAFKHPMVQEVVYHSLVSDRRRHLHAAVAAELEKSLPDPNGAQAAFLAYHFEEAGNTAMAASYTFKAAIWHGTRDPGQALDAWKRTRRLLASLKLDGAARYPLLMANGQIVNLGWREGLTASEVEPYYLEALDIATSLRDMRAITLLTAAYGRALASTGSAKDYVTKVNEALGLLDRQKHAGLTVVLTAIRCHALKQAGDLRAALEDNDVALAGVDRVEAQDQETLGFKVPVWVKGMRGQILAMMGRFDEARDLAMELIGSGQSVDSLHRMLAHGIMIDIAWGLNDESLAAEHSLLNQKLGEGSGNPYLMAYGRAYVGVAQSMRGDLAGATTSLSEALHFARRRHIALENEARMLADLAHVQLKAGFTARAIATAEEAGAIARRRGAKVWLAYAEWVSAGPASPVFKDLLEETGAGLLAGLPRDAG